ncbi:MAG: TSUP family transporter, partial [Kiloniellales bacterium]|nr:TSUP family transporter [Kiloniellales bacterium]
TTATVALALSLSAHDLLPLDLGLLSALALAPAALGMLLGQSVRRRLPEARFRRVFFGALLVLGVYIVARALV